MKLLAEISGHGFGHLGQSAEVLNQFCSRQPQTELYVRTTAEARVVQSRFTVPYTLIHGSSDIGMIMHSALEVDIAASQQFYADYHQHWQQNIEQLAEWLTANAFDAVFSNISYAILAAAKLAGLPSIALCSLNWAEIYQGYCAEFKQSTQIVQQMRHAYSAADAFICPAPSMSMSGLTNLHHVGPIARVGENRRADILDILNRKDSLRLVLVTPGGIPTGMPIEKWPRCDDLFWIISWEADVQRPDVISQYELGIHFCDLLASCDVVLTKPGYGIVAEAVCAAKPVIFTRRGDWPEEPFLLSWLASHTAVRDVSRQRFMQADVLDEIEALLQAKPVQPPLPTGAAEAANIMATCFKM